MADVAQQHLFLAQHLPSVPLRAVLIRHLGLLSKPAPLIMHTKCEGCR